MPKKSNYITTNRSKHYLKCHLIFVCKYRKPMLVGELNDDIKQIFQFIGLYLLPRKDSNLERLHQKQLCYQLHHKPIIYNLIFICWAFPV